MSVAAATPLYQQAGTQFAFWLLFGLFALGEAAMRFRSRFVNTGGTRAERWTLVAVVAGVRGGLLGGLAAAQWQAAQVTAARWPLFITGLVLMAAGVFIGSGPSSRWAGSSPQTSGFARVRRWLNGAPTAGYDIPPTAVWSCSSSVWA